MANIFYLERPITHNLVHHPCSGNGVTYGISANIHCPEMYKQYQWNILPLKYCTKHSTFLSQLKLAQGRVYQTNNIHGTLAKLEIATDTPYLALTGELLSVVCDMITSSSGNIFRAAGHLCWEFTGPRWIPRTKASDAELWCKQWWGWWFEMPSSPLWRHSNGVTGEWWPRECTTLELSSSLEH